MTKHRYIHAAIVASIAVMTTAEAYAHNRASKLVNDTRDELQNVYVRYRGGDWGRDLLASYTIPSGWQMKELEPDQVYGCDYEIWVVYTNDDVQNMTYYLCQTGSIRLY